MAVKGLSAVARGHGIGIPRGDVRQLPGVFIMDTGSRIRFSHFAREPKRTRRYRRMHDKMAWRGD
jgi:hypothetical protein